MIPAQVRHPSLDEFIQLDERTFECSEFDGNDYTKVTYTANGISDGHRDVSGIDYQNDT
jgi:hypothetical protein